MRTVLPEDEVDAVVVFAVYQVVGAVLGENEVHTVVVADRVIGAVLAEDEVHAVVVANRVIGAVLRQLDGAQIGAMVVAAGIFTADRVVVPAATPRELLNGARNRRNGSGHAGFATGCGGCARGHESERGKDCGEKGGVAVHERLLRLLVG